MRRLRIGAALLDGDNLDLSFASQDSDTHVVRMALEADVDASIADGEVRQADPIERFGQSPTREGDAARGRVHVHAERGGKQQNTAPAAQACGAHATG